MTMQVRPSRFLHELLPSARTCSAETVHNEMTTHGRLSNGLPTVVWNRGRGVKDFVAGRDVPEYCANSFVAESTFSLVHSLDGSHTHMDKNVHYVSIGGSQSMARVDIVPNNCQKPNIEASFANLEAGDIQLLSFVKTGVQKMCEQKIQSKRHLCSIGRRNLTRKDARCHTMHS